MVLVVFVKLIKISAPTPYSDNQIRILLRMLLCINKPVAVDRIELQLVSAQFDIFLNEHGCLLYTHIISQNGIVYFYCKRSAVDDIG